MLRSFYCQTLSVQVHDAMPMVRDWFFKEFEKTPAELAKGEKIEIHNQLVKTESFEKFIHTRYVGKKRFSIEEAAFTLSCWLMMLSIKLQ